VPVETQRIEGLVEEVLLPLYRPTARIVAKDLSLIHI
jgi:hypothetical protein